MGLCQGEGLLMLFILRGLAEQKIRFFIFVDLGKAFDWVPREIILFDLKPKGGPEYLVDGVMSL